MSTRLEAVLDRARTVGFLGPGPIRAHIDHAERYVAAMPDSVERLLDLGSGGGVPGLPMLLARPGLHGVLLDAATKRGAFLTWAVVELDLADRVEVVTGRAEILARRLDLRAAFDLVVARGFGPPSVTLENARGFLAPGGRLVISEPPGGRRWPASALVRLGLDAVPGSSEVAVFVAMGEPPDDVPRPHKVQQRSPLF